ncbi:helix-turn-helix domain-containing protein [Sporosarcina sp. 179-K 3D1 HS]|uniref:helix-turn-helix domain-containing protein n=1 Tax=Sporosarcina sp. 179-K 3D1 HS TaxID=3232169 RepID=UPI0039A0364E
MFDLQFFESYLHDKGIHSAFQIWESTFENPDGRPIRENEQMIIPQSPKPQSLHPSLQQITHDGQTMVYFIYSVDYHLMLCFQCEYQFSLQDLQVLYHLLYPLHTNYVVNSGKAKLNTIIETISDTTSSLDLEEVFSNILVNTLEVITNADYGTLWFYDPELDRLVCEASEGFLLDEIWHMQFEVGEGPIGHSFEWGVPLLIQDPSEISKKGIKRISEENERLWDRTSDYFTTIKSVLAYPIFVDGKVERVMYLGQLKTDHLLNEQDLWLLKVFTTQVGIAIRNARQFADIKELNNRLIKRDHIHSTLTNLSIRNMGAEKIVQELGRMVGQKLLFVDLMEQEWFPASKKIPHDVSFKDLLKIASEPRESNQYELTHEGEVTHHLYPIRSGTVILGCLIVDAQKPLNRLGQMALEQGTSVLALELVQKQNISEFYYKHQRELFNSLIQMNDPTVRLQIASELGIQEESEFATAVFQYTDYTDSQLLEAYVHRLIAQIKKNAAPYIQTIFGYQNKVIVLASLPTPSDRTTFEKRVNELLEESAATKKFKLSGGMGSIYKGIHLIGKSYQEALTALSNPASRQVRNRIVKYSDIGINRLFTNQNTEEINRFLIEIFEPLELADKTNQTLEKTLLTYFDCNRSAVEAAQSLHIHINTLYQRLKKIEDSLQLSFKNPEDVLRLQLACYLKQSLGIQ